MWRLGLLLALVVAAGCGSAAETEWPGPPKPDAGGHLSVKSFDDYLDGYPDYATSPEALATEFLRLDELQAARRSLLTTGAAEGGDAATVVASLDGILDDSVASARYVLTVTRVKDGWRLQSATRTQRCRAGRGHAGFSADPCV